MNSINQSWIKLRQNLDHDDYKQLNALHSLCTEEEPITLKLELEYKLGVALENADKTGIHDVNEFMYFMGQELIGYMGICSFGGAGMPLEITGMVHPDYRRKGIGTQLHGLVMAECERRNSGTILLLCDKESASGQSFLKKLGASYKYSEFEMVLEQDRSGLLEEQLGGIALRKAVNGDAYEIARQNAIYFGDEQPNAQIDGAAGDQTGGASDGADSGLLMPETEEKRGMTICLGEKDGEIIGKVHLQIAAGVGGIYGLGVLPQYRGKGYGKAILLGAVEKLKQAGVEEIMLQVAAENTTALSLYMSCGFRERSIMDYFELS